MENTPDQKKKQAQGFEWLWPKITDIKSAKDAAKQGVGVAIFVAGVTALFAILSLFGVEMVTIWALLDAAIFAGIAFAIYKMSRVAAIFGLAFYLWGQVNAIGSTGKVNIFMLMFITFGFINAIRGTFAYHKLLKSEIQV